MHFQIICTLWNRTVSKIVLKFSGKPEEKSVTLANFKVSMFQKVWITWRQCIFFRKNLHCENWPLLKIVHKLTGKTVIFVNF